MTLVFGKYERIRRIAQGGMGEVFLARQTGVLDRLAILKSLRGDLASESDFVEQFLDEARVAATLNHPNIVAIYDVGEWDEQYYIAMEYVPGEDLSKLWYAAAKAGVGLPFQVSVRVCYEAALGLDHAHRARDMRGSPLSIVHRDVSPQNIMVRGDGVVKLVDFGIAKAANKSSRTQVGMVKGKLQYMSPEQVRGDLLDGRSDQFSLGVVLWEMCTGRRLFKADTEQATLHKILQAPIPKPSAHVPGFPPELEATILRMLQREADKRFRSCGDAAQELKGYLDRSALQGGDSSVGDFVQQILGAELEARVADLTPEATAPRPSVQSPAKPQAKPPASSSAPSSAPSSEPSSGPSPPARPVQPPPRPASTSAGADRTELFQQQNPSVTAEADQLTAAPVSREDDAEEARGGGDGEDEQPLDEDAPTRVVSEGDLLKAAGQTTWQVKTRAGGEPRRFTDLGVLVQAAERGEFGADDLISDDGKSWAKLKEMARLSHIFTSTSGRVERPEPSPGTPATGKTAARPAPPPKAPQQPPLAELDALLPAESPEGDGGAAGFSLGNLPQGQTGTWGAPEIARALAAPLGVPTELGASASDAARSGIARPRRVPTAVWVAGGVVVALLAFVGVLAGWAPDVLARLVRPSVALVEVEKAVQASRGDDPTAVAALLSSVEATMKQAPPSSDMLAGAAILQLAVARVEEQRAALARLVTGLGLAAAPGDVEPSGAEVARARAYKLATEAAAGEDLSPGALLALALHQAESGGRVEFDADAARVADACRGKPCGALVDRELAVARASLEARAGLESGDAAGASAALRGLDALGDLRATHLALVLRAQRASRAPPDVRAQELAPLRAGLDAMRAATGEHARMRLLAVVIQQPPASGQAAPQAAPQGQDAAASAASSASSSTPPLAAPDAASPPPGAPAAPPASASATSEAPPQPDTYDAAMERAERARKAGRNREAGKEALKALKLRPDDLRARRLAGLCFAAAAQWEIAEGHLRAALAADASDCDVQFGLAETLNGRGKTEDARASYQRYVDSCPSGRKVEDARAAILRLE